MAEQKKENEIEMRVLADKFINLANALVIDSKQDGSRVSAAMRFAVARFNAHEAAMKTPDLAVHRDDAIAWFSNQYKEMLTENIDEHIQRAKQAVQQ